MATDVERGSAPTKEKRHQTRSWWQLLPAIAVAGTFGFFFVDKTREAGTVLRSGRGLLTVGVIVAAYVAAATGLRRVSRSAWMPPVALTVVILALAGWIVRPYYVDETANRTLVTGEVQDAPLQDVAAPVPGDPAQAAPGAAPAAAAAGSAARGPSRISSGALRGIDHDASGRASLVESADGRLVVRLEGFAIEGSPDPQVYLAEGKDVRRPTGAKLGPLPGNKGEVLDIAVPEGVRAGRDWTILVWCGRFGVPIANATQA
ncbi:MAG TPA: DM13 domain-containing protein [Mycobacteriales bacterium]|nr:DM13 domain-containing protein [Mycobacteriales bacterium]